jgi:hypothetical protein
MFILFLPSSSLKSSHRRGKKIKNTFSTTCFANCFALFDFVPDEYTRITTPRQDVLFKKGYLSRMNNKTASNLSATVNSTESTAASSTITTSDPDSSVSTLSPATTPSMDYGQVDSMEYAPMYYPGYYDENGMLVIREFALIILLNLH